MSKAFYKHKLLLDEHMYTRQEYPRLNEHFDVKHIRDDLHQDGAKDPVVYQRALVEGRIAVTANGRHFWRLVDAASPGVVDVPASWSRAQVDSSLTALLMRHGPRYFSGRYRTLATE
jgi:Domain of unknown function (DUF5615)